jgi:hypothetical protein
MNTKRPIDDPRLIDLLADQAAFGLSTDEQAELIRLLQGAPHFDAEALERIAAVVELAMLAPRGPGRLERLPTALRDRVAADAPRHIKSAAANEAQGSVSGDEPRSDLAQISTRRDKTALSHRGPLYWLGWATAAALLIVSGSLLVSRPRSELNPIVAYQQLVASVSPDVIRANWIDPAKPDDSQPRGDIVWDGLNQRGYMRFNTLPANSPKKEQYQLWIFDTAQDDRYPIDGGVFDIEAARLDSETGAYIVPIRAKLRVVQPTMFAVTIEKPGGVVVSSRERLPLLAKLP